MSLIKKLAGEAAWYGLPSIVGRILHYLVFGLFLTYILPENIFGEYTLLYAFAAFATVILGYRLDTALFRFGSDQGRSSQSFSTASIGVALIVLIFGAVLYMAAPMLASILTEGGEAHYVRYFVLIVGFDSLASIPFAKLRLDNRPKKFALLKILNVVLNISLALSALVIAPKIAPSWYSEESQIEYLFVANLIASALILLLISPEFFRSSFDFEFNLLKKMFVYASPLILVSILGQVNMVGDRFFLNGLLDPEIAKAQVGIYTSGVKLALLLSLMNQAFLYAAEPFFFKNANRADSKQIYADVTLIYILVATVVFLGIVLNLDLLQFLIGKDFRASLPVVPILLVGYMFLGLFYNFSIWYKIKDKTHLGAWIALAGAMVTIGVNILFIPKMGYMACAWAVLGCYLTMCIVCYFLSRRYFPIPWPIMKIGIYMGISIAIYILSLYIKPDAFQPSAKSLAINIALIVLYTIVIWRLEGNNIKRILQTS